ncbi:hypothetical protein K8352_02270 [Flavobacteriaceae bacterium F89]|uniref:DUF4179 domain-containing protein n=1 Tax=Cerina litoralis TaxID=2874477 RepID=A0AAE3JN66_9FLAO|nr:hypothetical protein [Cerina litoralis]MCG2459569.1 hypothetical protein [Cerina litoralis]
MMKKIDLESVFKELEGTFDTEIPQEGHQARFLQKLRGQKVVSQPRTEKSWWRPLAIAASIAVLLSVGLGLFNSFPTKNERIAKISPEASKTGIYFANLVNEQINVLKKESSPETERIIDDTMAQLATLDSDYQKMEQDLLQGGNSKLILSAMINNFQTRIALLQDVLNQIEAIKSVKNKSDETSINKL